MQTGLQLVREKQPLLFSSCAELSLPHGAHYFYGSIFTSLNLSHYQMWLSKSWLQISPAVHLDSYLLTSA